MGKKISALIAPIIIPVLFFSGRMIFFDRSDSRYLSKTIFETLIGILPFSYLFSFVVGIPVLLILSKINKLNAIALVLSGAMGGALVMIAISICTSGFERFNERGFSVALSALAGLIVSSLFCALAKIPVRAV